MVVVEKRQNHRSHTAAELIDSCVWQQSFPFARTWIMRRQDDWAHIFKQSSYQRHRFFLYLHNHKAEMKKKHTIFKPKKSDWVLGREKKRRVIVSHAVKPKFGNEDFKKDERKKPEPTLRCQLAITLRHEWLSAISLTLCRWQIPQMMDFWSISHCE